ncbi:MAG: biopolymer transporter ExbD [Puniceicoccales bacterium]|jgi:biopolymer transport protein ExbD|nr:biopolymer transporter ExbD [Puniceicoccales bacterium]
MGGGGGGGDGEPEFQVAPLIDVLLVMLIFFMSITTSQVLKIDASIKLPVVKHAEKTKAEEGKDNKVKVSLINISWNGATAQATYKLDDIVIGNTDTEAPVLPNGKPIIEELSARKKSGGKDYRMLIRADEAVQAKFLNTALKWGAQAGIDNISFSGKDK